MHEIYGAVFVKMWPWYIGGPAIGLYVLLFLYFKNRLLSASSTFGFIVDQFFPQSKKTDFFSGTDYAREPNWLGYYFIGLFVGGFASTLLAGAAIVPDLPGFSSVYPFSLPAKLAVLGFSGLLIGFGTRMSGGCTSGHCIVGVSALQKPSMVATAVFFGFGILISFAVEHLIKGSL